MAVGASFHSTADIWDATFESATTRGQQWRARFSTALRLLGDGPGDALDVGMGPGRLLAELENRGWTVSGVDASPRMVELARARLPSSAERLVVAHAERLPFPDASFDAAACIGVLGYAHLDDALLELARILRPGGRLVVSFGRGRAPYRVWRSAIVDPLARAVKRVAPFGRALPPHRRCMSAQAFRTRLAEAGLEVETIEHTGASVLVDPLDVLFPRLAVWLAERAESLPRLRRVFGMHLVALARKPAQLDSSTAS